jgi:hypothetical protein
MSNAAQTTTTARDEDAGIFDAIKQWGALWRAIQELPDHDPRSKALFNEACELEWTIAEKTPLTVEDYYAKRAAIEAFEFDDENFLEFIFQLGHDAGRLGLDGEMPDRTPR